MSVESPRNYPNIVNIFKFLRSTKLRFFESLRDSNNSVNFEVRNGKVETSEILRREILQSFRILSDSSTTCSNSKNSLTIGKHDRYETNASIIYKYASLVPTSDRSPFTNPIILQKNQFTDSRYYPESRERSEDFTCCCNSAIIFTIFSRLGACTRAIVAARQIPCYLNIKRIP